LKNYKSSNNCVSCGKGGDGFVCFHHIKSRGSGGPNEAWNLMPLCFKCHELIHKKGTNFMANKSMGVKDFLQKNEWFYCEIAKKWRHLENDTE